MADYLNQRNRTPLKSTRKFLLIGQLHRFGETFYKKSPKNCLLTSLLFINFAIFLHCSRISTPTLDESRMVSAGISHWESSNFEIASETPPLTRMISAVPILVFEFYTGPLCESGQQKYWSHALDEDAASRIASQFAYANFRCYPYLIRLARLPGFAWWVLGAWVITSWAQKLHGIGAARIALILWSTMPNIVARECTATAHLPTAVICLASSYAVWRWLQARSWEWSLLAGALTGLSLLVDYASLVFLLIFFTIILVDFLKSLRSPRKQSLRVKAGQILVSLVLCLYVLHLGSNLFQTEISTKRLKSEADSPKAFAKHSENAWLKPFSFWLPSDYLKGIDQRIADLSKQNGTPANGTSETNNLTWKNSSAFFAKMPLGLWLLLSLTVFPLFLQFPEDQHPLPLIVGIPIAAIPAFSLAVHPSFLSPETAGVIFVAFAIVAISGLTCCVRTRRPLGWPLGAGIGLTVASSLAFLPYPLHYLNELSGGWSDFRAQLLHALPNNSGQDLGRLKHWLDEHPEAVPIRLASWHVVDPNIYGIKYTTAPIGPVARRLEESPWQTPWGGPAPGYYALDLYSLAQERYQYFHLLRPIFRAGASIFIYHISQDDAEKVRSQLGIASEKDFLALRSWLKDQTDLRVLHLGCQAPADPKSLEIHSANQSVSVSVMGTDKNGDPWSHLSPGYYAMDHFSLAESRYRSFKFFKPIFQAGASVFVYKLTTHDIKRARASSGLSPSVPSTTSKVDASQRGFLKRTYRESQGENFEYTLFVPFSYTGHKPYPLILFLHGYGDGVTKGHRYLEVGFPPAIARRQHSFEFIAVCPRVRTGTWPAGGEDARTALEILATVENEYKVDKKRIYLTGLSSGGEGVFNLAARYPERWAAIVPVSSGGCDPNQAESIKHIPCWCFHNLYDEGSLPTLPRRMMDMLRSLGGKPRYTEFFEFASDRSYGDPIQRHNAWDKAYNMPELYEWLSAQHLP